MDFKRPAGWSFNEAEARTPRMVGVVDNGLSSIGALQ